MVSKLVLFPVVGRSFFLPIIAAPFPSESGIPFTRRVGAVLRVDLVIGLRGPPIPLLLTLTIFDLGIDSIPAGSVILGGSWICPTTFIRQKPKAIRFPRIGGKIEFESLINGLVSCLCVTHHLEIELSTCKCRVQELRQLEWINNFWISSQSHFMPTSKRILDYLGLQASRSPKPPHSISRLNIPAEGKPLA